MTEIPTFDDMINEAYSILEQEEKSGLMVLPDIDVEIEITRLHWKNVKDYLRVISRHPEHFMEWIKYEISNKEINWYSANIKDGLIIHGKRQKKSDITDLAMRYIKEFVICSSCNAADTKMTKLGHKKHDFECLNCGMKKCI